MKTSACFIALLLASGLSGLAQVSINNDNSSADPSTMLDVKSTDKGFLPPRMTQVQRNAISSPAEGLMVICTDCGNQDPVALSMFLNGAWRLMTGLCLEPLAPASLQAVPSITSITWNWNQVPGATGYRWNTTDDFGTATDMDTATTNTETGLTCNTPYTRYAWAYNDCGHSPALTMIQSTSACPFICGSGITIHHVTGDVAPVDKTVTYGTVTNIPGEPSKCWITSNLGADHQAAAVNDATEPSAGWYWQFNRKQGYKHDGATRTPNTTWINSINEDSDWLPDNDPCAIELGTGWRLPSYSEYDNIDNAGNWTEWNGPWNSALKMHAAGYLEVYDGQLNYQGAAGFYRTNLQHLTTHGFSLRITGFECYLESNAKAYGFSVRCLKE